MNLLTALALNHFLPTDASVEEAVRLSLMYGIFFVFTAFGSTYAFADKKMLLLLIDSLYHVAKLVIMAIILVALK